MFQNGTKYYQRNLLQSVNENYSNHLVTYYPLFHNCVHLLNVPPAPVYFSNYFWWRPSGLAASPFGLDEMPELLPSLLAIPASVHRKKNRAYGAASSYAQTGSTS